jgi:hypothetical protein
MFEQIVKRPEFSHHLLMMTVTLMRSSRFDPLAHKNIDSNIWSFFVCLPEPVDVISNELEISCIFLAVPIVVCGLS